ncbi:MAG TPA: TetR/AcrR family transcriptional regulator [Candidatus Dormibacteraeota bacterium]|jgi:AcrR family transcriptional regulator|nr:TetR/AcrR family transcriptional regulator [Candidatus Dormibacteraeota bacterium]
MVAQAASALDRRSRRRQETIEEVLDIAAAIMAEQGVAGLSVGEIARRMGMRPPSLYVYFPSKHALYDALFARGARAVLATMEGVVASLPAEATLDQQLTAAAANLVRWSMEHQAYSQLLFWRPVPGFTPSPEAYEPAVRLVEISRRHFAQMQSAGLLRADVPVDVIVRDWIVVTAGVVSQQLSNLPHESFEEGTYTAALPGLVAMFVRHYGAPAGASEGRHGADTR